jgi:hypothetical protein
MLPSSAPGTPPSLPSHPAALARALGAVFFLGAFVPAGGCVLFVGASCPDLDEVCPDVQCENYRQNRDGCSMCECVEGRACERDSDCPSGEVCDERGVCVEETSSGCRVDADCAPDHFCASSGANERPAPPPEEQDPIFCQSDADCGVDGKCFNGGCVFDGGVSPPPQCFADSDCPAGLLCDGFGSCIRPSEQGVCVPFPTVCPDIAMPGCPPDHILVVDFSADPCGVWRCLPAGACELHGPQTCTQDPGCELLDGGGGEDGGAAPCFCEPNTDCDGCEVPPPSAVCVPRASCLSHEECGPDGLCFVPVCCEADEGGRVVGCDDSCDQRRFCMEATSPPPEGLCLDDGECAPEERCTFHPDVCLSDGLTRVCRGWCAGACVDAVTPAHDPATGQCVVFSDGCIPPGWERSEGC